MNQSQTSPSKRYIGDKPVVEHSEVPYDRYAWERQSGALKLGMKVKDLADEPDEEPRFDEDIEPSKEYEDVA